MSDFDPYALPTEPGDPRDRALARQAIEIEELRQALGQALDKMRQTNSLIKQAASLTGHYL